MADLVQQDRVEGRTAAYLPADAESTRVALALSAARQPTTPAIVLYVRPSGITADDRARATADAAHLRAIGGVAGPVDGPQPSGDGSSLLTIVPIESGSGGWDQISRPVEQIRHRLDPDPAGQHGVTEHWCAVGGHGCPDRSKSSQARWRGGMPLMTIPSMYPASAPNTSRSRGTCPG